jgi:hypothetical protein
MKQTALLLALTALPAATTLAATPCGAPEQFVRLSKTEVRVPAEPTPLLRPYVVGGVATLSIRDAGGERWLELAVNSVPEARRLLALRADAPLATVASWRDRVWLRCGADEPRT